MYQSFVSRSEVIKSLGVAEAGLKQVMLVALMADIVNHETEHGELTQKAGNQALEDMDYWTTFKAITKDCGFTWLGNGHFSVVFSHESMPGRVLKVGLKKEDSGSAYAAFCRMHQGREGIPNIYDIQRHDGCYTVVLDHLKRFDGSASKAENLKELATYLIESSERHPVAETWDAQSAALAETSLLIREFFRGIARFDMHAGNVMIHPKSGALIITDPVSFTNKLKHEFKVSAEDLVAEVEAIELARKIDQCRNRKAKCDPKGDFQQHRKAVRKHRKKLERHHKERIDAGKIKRQEERAKNRVLARLGATLDTKWRDEAGIKVFWENETPIMQKVADERLLADLNAIANGRDLLIDKRIDAMFRG